MQLLVWVIAMGALAGLSGCGGQNSDDANAVVANGITENSDGVERSRVSPREGRDGLATEDGSATAVNMFKVNANFATDTAAERLTLVDSAQAVGANTILLTDSKLTRWGVGAPAGNRWLREMRAFRQGVQARGLKLVVNTITVGYCTSFLATNPALTTGYPIIDQPMRATGSRLLPVTTSRVPNGGFEQAAGNIPNSWTFQDDPGVRTFVDQTVARSGSASLRLDGRGGESSRIQTSISVKPWHQYTLKFWVRTANLTARPEVLIRRADRDVRLTSQHLSSPAEDGGRRFIRGAQDLDLDWTQMRIAFNSQDNTSIRLMFALFGGSAGSFWVDDLTISDSPTLNWIQRDDLPVAARLQNGPTIAVGADVNLPPDPLLGEIGYTGRFGTYHDGPSPEVSSGGAVSDGDIVLISGWHAQVTAAGQIGCSWLSTDVRTLMRNAHQRIQNEFGPDGYLLNYDEIRTGGFEPSDKVLGSSGAALAASIAGAYEDLFQVAPDAEHYFWSDMIDPIHNARADYYQVANTLDGSWQSLDPAKVTIINWWSGQKVLDKGPASLRHFADLGFRQVIGGFYDEDVAANYQRWQIASEGIAGIDGSLYATWREDYSQIEAFGFLWW
ncbi:MAG: carbohydrate binding domain-containing protein [Burkholderiaceae bacterium]